MLNKFALLIIAAILVIVSLNINSGKDYSSGMIMSDGKGYYAWLPAIFIYHDLHFHFFDQIEKEKYFSQNHYYDYRMTIDDKVINKYYAGTALAMLPFFGIGHLMSAITGEPLDGYSSPYTSVINLAAICYLTFGLLFLSKLLKTYQIRQNYRTLILFAIVFGTNVFYYTVVEFAMSHVYSFAFATTFLYFSRQYFLRHTASDLLIAGFMLGMITLIRPVNVIILLVVPFLAGSWNIFQNGVKEVRHHWAGFCFSVLLFVTVLSVQAIIYRIQTGHPWIYSYGQEKFYFNHPHILAILFSYKKGLFLYTPLLFISLAGLYFLWKQNRFSALWLFGFLFLLTYVLSSWWMWYYGGSFSSRVFIEYFGLFAVMLGVTLERLTKKTPRKIYITLIVLLTIFCQIQTYQYRYYFIHWSEMSKEKYWEVFMRVDLLIDKGQ